MHLVGNKTHYCLALCNSDGSNQTIPLASAYPVCADSVGRDAVGRVAGNPDDLATGWRLLCPESCRVRPDRAKPLCNWGNNLSQSGSVLTLSNQL